jgi:hydroxysqualene dehydroxylase
MKVAVIGAGWAGCAAAVEATRLGHQVTLYEAARVAGGRARRVDGQLGGENVLLDNGQHILIGAYTETLRLMESVGIETASVLLRMPLTLRFPDGDGLQFRALASPFDALHAIATARGWTWHDRLSLLGRALRWRLAGFQCAASASVADLSTGLPLTVLTTLIEPLCVSALNTPANRASGQVFLRVLQDGLFQGSGGSNLLVPRVDLSALLPHAALSWLVANGSQVRLGTRVQALVRRGESWVVSTNGQALDTRDEASRQAFDDSALFERVVLACPVAQSQRLVSGSGIESSQWQTLASALTHEALTTVFAFAAGPYAADGATLSQPMLTLRSNASHPAQFVFDRGQCGGPAGLLAFVISASEGNAAALTEQVLAQAQVQLGLQLQPVQTIVEKRATFSCTPGLQRPPTHVAAGLLACGDYIAGPYPATLEGAVRSGLAAARELLVTGPHPSPSRY